MSATILEYIDQVFSEKEDVLKYFYKHLYKDYSPDINGYNLIFMLPPDLSGWKSDYPTLYKPEKTSKFFDISNFITFSAIDFSPPTHQVNTEKISARSGAIPYATEISHTEQCSITYIENHEIDIFHMHHMWIEYIRAIIEGFVEPEGKYITPGNPEFGAIDYCTSAYIVRYAPDLKTIRFIGKCVGIFPQTLPSKELIGQRTSNELTTLPFTYFVAGYREMTWRETGHWILKEFEELVKANFS